jgi:competence protein ComEA
MMKTGLICAVLAAAVGSSAWAGPINVNSADAKALAKELDGVGDKTAAAIVAERQANGPFKSAEDLNKRVKGFGDKTLEKNKDNIKLGDK